eukprot:tig00000254_g22478.t1
MSARSDAAAAPSPGRSSRGDAGNGSDRDGDEWLPNLSAVEESDGSDAPTWRELAMADPELAYAIRDFDLDSPRTNANGAGTLAAHPAGPSLSDLSDGVLRRIFLFVGALEAAGTCRLDGVSRRFRRVVWEAVEWPGPGGHLDLVPRAPRPSSAGADAQARAVDAMLTLLSAARRLFLWASAGRVRSVRTLSVSVAGAGHAEALSELVAVVRESSPALRRVEARLLWPELLPSWVAGEQGPARALPLLRALQAAPTIAELDFDEPFATAALGAGAGAGAFRWGECAFLGSLEVLSIPGHALDAEEGSALAREAPRLRALRCAARPAGFLEIAKLPSLAELRCRLLREAGAGAGAAAVTGAPPSAFAVVVRDFAPGLRLLSSFAMQPDPDVGGDAELEPEPEGVRGPAAGRGPLMRVLRLGGRSSSPLISGEIACVSFISSLQELSLQVDESAITNLNFLTNLKSLRVLRVRADFREDFDRNRESSSSSAAAAVGAGGGPSVAEAAVPAATRFLRALSRVVRGTPLVSTGIEELHVDFGCDLPPAPGGQAELEMASLVRLCATRGCLASWHSCHARRPAAFAAASSASALAIAELCPAPPALLAEALAAAAGPRLARVDVAAEAPSHEAALDFLLPFAPLVQPWTFL